MRMVKAWGMKEILDTITREEDKLSEACAVAVLSLYMKQYEIY